MNEPLTAHELAQRLLAGPDLPVHQGYDYGDRTHRTAAPGVTDVCEAKIRHSDYIDTDQVVDEDDSEFEEARDVIVLSHFDVNGGW